MCKITFALLLTSNQIYIKKLCYQQLPEYFLFFSDFIKMLQYNLKMNYPNSSLLINLILTAYLPLYLLRFSTLNIYACTYRSVLL